MIPSGDDIRKNSASAMQTMAREAQQGFDVLAFGREIAAGLSGVDSKALPSIASIKGPATGMSM